jgi:hypothetical protein
MTPQLAEAIGPAVVLGAVIRPLLVATILFGLWQALKRSQLALRLRLRAWVTVAVGLIGWLTLVWILAEHAFFAALSDYSQIAQAGMILVPTIALVIGSLLALTRSETVAAAIDAAPLWWLIAYQVYRVAGLIFLRLWSHGFLPGYFALPAGVGDLLTGVLALLVVAAFLQSSPWAKPLAYGVNIFGMIDLLNAITLGVLGSLSATTDTSALLLYPFVLVPTFGVPLAFIIHALSIWQLRRREAVPSGFAVYGLNKLHETA